MLGARERELISRYEKRFRVTVELSRASVSDRHSLIELGFSKRRIAAIRVLSSSGERETLAHWPPLLARRIQTINRDAGRIARDVSRPRRQTSFLRVAMRESRQRGSSSMVDVKCPLDEVERRPRAASDRISSSSGASISHRNRSTR